MSTTNAANENATTEVIEGGFNPSVPQTHTQSIVPLTSANLTRFTEADQKKIVELADKIDPLETEKIMVYGESPLIKAFEFSGRILASREGTTADQEIIQKVRELSKEANEKYEDFKLELKEPTHFQKFLLKIFSSMKEKQDKELKVKALTNFKLLEQLRDSCDSWLDVLKNTFADISLSAKSDEATCEELEQYIVAGRIAEERIIKEVEAAKQTYETSGLIADKTKYEDMKLGLSTLQIVLLNLEKSRAASLISMGQLSMQLTTNQNIQIAVRTQRANSMTVAAQQLRNAVLNAENSLALENQKSVTALNSELMKKISEGTVLTAEESERALLSGVFTNEAALIAAQTVVNGCQAIQAANDERIEKIGQGLEELKSVLNELVPVINERKLSSTDSGKKSTPAAGKLVF